MNRRKFLKTSYSGTFMFESFNQLLKKSASSLIRCYQWTRFLRRPSCRFYPSCSEYTNKCIQRHGFFKGVLAGSLRIARCHPFHPGGLDEVPESICLFKPISNRNFER